VAVCRAPSGVPLFSSIFVIMMENTSWSSLRDNPATNTPYIHNTLIKNAVYATDYHGVTHPSLPNYLAIISGSPGKQSDGSAVGCDCNPTGTPACTSSCNPLTSLISPCACPQTAMHLGDQIEAVSGLSWKAYAEDIGTACNGTSSGNYAARHVPFVYFMHDTAFARCQSHVVDFGMLNADLMGTTPSFAFITPNLIDDMHGVGLTGQTQADLKNGDGWLGMHVPTITSSAAYKKAGVLFIVWDEDDGSTGDNPIPLFVLSPLAKSGGTMIATQADHYALLATIEDGLGLARLGSAAQATPLVDFFPAQ
jgi:hypothetical protein